MLKLPVYLDHNSTTPCDPAVLDTMLPWFTQKFGNAASRTHPFGWEAEGAIDLAREQVAELVGAESAEIIFTSGATESVNLAIKGVFEMYAPKGNHIITLATEHKAVLDTCKHLEKLGAELTVLPVDHQGMADLDLLEKTIRPETVMIAVMYANNETGVIQPITEIGAFAKKHGVIFFCDATQAVGKIPVNVIDDGIDLLALSAHKMYGPKGVGALYVRRKNPRVRLTAQIDGGGHERGMRSGTLNVPGIVGLGAACVQSAKVMKEEAARLGALRDKLEHSLLDLGDSFVNGNPASRLPHTTNISFRDVDQNALMLAFNKNIAVSSGSACTSASMEPSYVLTAMGLEGELAHGSLRFGLGRFTTEEEIDFVIQEVKKSVEKLRALV